MNHLSKSKYHQLKQKFKSAKQEGDKNEDIFQMGIPNLDNSDGNSSTSNLSQ